MSKNATFRVAPYRLKGSKNAAHLFCHTQPAKRANKNDENDAKKFAAINFFLLMLFVLDVNFDDGLLDDAVMFCGGKTRVIKSFLQEEKTSKRSWKECEEDF
jgi:hypothetical protein